MSPAGLEEGGEAHTKTGRVMAPRTPGSFSFRCAGGGRGDVAILPGLWSALPVREFVEGNCNVRIRA